MKQKIEIKVCMPCDGCRAKALEMSARAEGVISLEITGDDRDKLEVVGVGVDVTGLVICLRKKVCFAEIVKVEEVKDKEEEEEEEKKPECKPPCCPPYYCGYPPWSEEESPCKPWYPPYCGYASPPPVVICDEPRGCSIM
uniref:HMA domain-containing protein n=1 Tax=Leersia perrieri TaxID=77586 RepID=A0A0D9W620_9ORYZ